MLLIKLFLGWRKSDQESESPQTIPSVHQVTDNNNNLLLTTFVASGG